MDEFKRVHKAYDEECRLNGGREGTTSAWGLLSQLFLLQKLLIEYFSVNADCVAIKRHR